jgi:DNA processing protein
VLGSGIDKPYPKVHEHLFDRIVEKGGAVLSHFPVGTPAAPYTFPQRNEIIAGLSRGLVVVEAKERSGSLITAQLALEMGKDVFAVPSDISRRNSLGANRLIQNASAKLLLSPDDILDEYGLTEVSPENRARESDAGSQTPLERNILVALDGNPLSIDALADSLRSDIREIQIELGKMEILGTIARNISGQYSLHHG